MCLRLRQGYTGTLFYVEGGEICEACIAGTYKPSAGTDDCLECPEGKFLGALGSNSSAACEACPTGSESPPGSTSVADCTCVAGYAGHAGGECVECASGKYKEGVGDDECIDCPDGHTSAPGSTSPNACLEVCGPGSFGPDGGPCDSCEEGTYKATSGSESCEGLCPDNSNSPAGSTSSADCKCNSVSLCLSDTLSVLCLSLYPQHNLFYM